MLRSKLERKVPGRWGFLQKMHRQLLHRLTHSKITKDNGPLNMPTKTKNVMLVLHRWQDQPLSFPPNPSSSCNFFFAKRYRDAVCAERCAVSPRTTPRAKEREKITPSKNIDIRLDFAVHRFSHRPNSCFDPSSNGKCPEDAVFCKRCTANFSID